MYNTVQNNVIYPLVHSLVFHVYIHTYLLSTHFLCSEAPETHWTVPLRLACES